MAKVNGIGGVFIRCADKAASMAWYEKNLGLTMESWGGSVLHFSAATAPEGKNPYAILSFFAAESTYFAPSNGSVVLNLRVDNLDEMVQQLQANGVALIDAPVDDDFGKFAWVLDPDGNKIELWEQK